MLPLANRHDRAEMEAPMFRGSLLSVLTRALIGRQFAGFNNARFPGWRGGFDHFVITGPGRDENPATFFQFLHPRVGLLALRVGRAGLAISRWCPIVRLGKCRSGCQQGSQGGECGGTYHAGRRSISAKDARVSDRCCGFHTGQTGDVAFCSRATPPQPETRKAWLLRPEGVSCHRFRDYRRRACPTKQFNG